MTDSEPGTVRCHFCGKAFKVDDKPHRCDLSEPVGPRRDPKEVYQRLIDVLEPVREVS